MPEKHIKNAEHSQNNKQACSQLYCLPALKRHIFCLIDFDGCRDTLSSFVDPSERDAGSSNGKRADTDVTKAQLK